MPRLTNLAVACVMAFTVTAATAGEIVYFTNGTFLKIDSHEIKGDMVQVQLDPSSRLAFPGRMIERIEGTTGVVWGKGAGPAANQQIPGVSLPATANANQGVHGFTAGAKKQWNPEDGSGLRGAKPAQAGFGMVGNSGEQSYLDGVVLQSRRDGPEGTITRGNKLIVNPEVLTSKGRGPVRFGAKNASPVSMTPPAQPPAVTPPPENPPAYVPVSDDPPSEPEPEPVPADDPPPDPGDGGADSGN